MQCLDCTLWNLDMVLSMTYVEVDYDVGCHELYVWPQAILTKILFGESNRCDKLNFSFLPDFFISSLLDAPKRESQGVLLMLWNGMEEVEYKLIVVIYRIQWSLYSVRETSMLPIFLSFGARQEEMPLILKMLGAKRTFKLTMNTFCSKESGWEAISRGSPQEVLDFGRNI